MRGQARRKRSPAICVVRQRLAQSAQDDRCRIILMARFLLQRPVVWQRYALDHHRYPVANNAQLVAVIGIRYTALVDHADILSDSAVLVDDRSLNG